MKKVKWTLITLIALVIIAFFHYSLPSHDIARIVGTEVKRVDLGNNTWFWTGDDPNADNTGSRDVRFIETYRTNNKEMVYRNEDTHWGWPPYFKFDSGDVSARAKNLISTSANPVWVDVMHYGWRIEVLSVYPNVISLSQVEGPDVVIIPWFNIIFLSLLAILVFWLWRRFRRWKNRHVDPMFASASDAMQSAGDQFGAMKDSMADSVADASYKATSMRDRFSSWLDTWRPKDKRKG
jgi:Protein of unknown function (DUF1523)